MSKDNIQHTPINSLNISYNKIKTAGLKIIG